MKAEVARARWLQLREAQLHANSRSRKGLTTISGSYAGVAGDREGSDFHIMSVAPQTRRGWRGKGKHRIDTRMPTDF